MADQPHVQGRATGVGEALTPARETIAAVATAAGRGGIGVVRVSGAHLESFARGLTDKELTPRKAERAAFKDADGETLDEGLILFFPAPHSYTGEDVVELHAHGGPVILRMLLARCVQLGARHAEPGEFTRRAFLNDKLDLAQAEAVADLIDASTEAAARCALRSLKGEFSARVAEFSGRLLELRMLVEATLDFPEEEIDDVDRGEVRARLGSLRESLTLALQQGKQGSVLRSGITVVLVGRPNVGKSSLLNRLAGEEVVLVTDVPGTTRDAVRQTIEVGGVPIHVIDTAGLRQTDDAVERLGMERTWASVQKADLALLVADAREGVQPVDQAILDRLPGALERLVVYNKVDLCSAGTTAPTGAIPTSAVSGSGIETLRGALLSAAGVHEASEELFMARDRHLAALADGLIALERAEGQIDRTELVAEELRLAQQHLNSITGEFTADDLLGAIFSRFCIGK